MNITEDFPALNPVNIAYTVCETLIGILAIFGNGIVIIVFCSEKKLRTNSNFFIVSLAFADFLLGLIGIPFAILIEIGLPRNFHVCMFAISILVGLCTISIFCLIGVSIDRYLLILRPLQYTIKSRSKRMMMINIGLCWFFGFIVGFLPIFWHNDSVRQRCIFAEKISNSYFVFFCIMSVILPILILVIIYGLIYRVVRNHVTKSIEKRINIMSIISEHNEVLDPSEIERIRELEKRELKVTRKLAMIVLVFVIFWLPLNVCNIINVVADKPEINPTVLLFCIALSHANSAFNPLLYAYNLKDFRKSFYKIFCCRRSLT